MCCTDCSISPSKRTLGLALDIFSEGVRPDEDDVRSAKRTRPYKRREICESKQAMREFCGKVNSKT